MRAGIGQYDAYYDKNSSFYLGGILFSVDSEDSLLTDDDLLINSIADALLGAAAIGGLSSYLKQKKNESEKILKKIERDIHYRGYRILNIDVSIMTSWLEIGPKLTEIHALLISMLYIKSEQLNLKLVPIRKSENQSFYKMKITTIALLNNRS